MTALIVFAKAPVPGRAKTRLAPALGEAGAALLAERLLEHTLHHAMGCGFAEVELCATPDAEHPAFTRLAARHPGLVLQVQGEGDLGRRMHRALARQLERHAAVLLIGTDAPALDSTTLQAAARALHEADAVFVPAHDGGYALVGLAAVHAALFHNIPWSTAAVMAQTRQRLHSAGLRWAELPAVPDIDEPADLVHLPAGWLP
jgi:uncharacterized protein